MNQYMGTIAAISTPPGKGGVALIRVSGPDAFEICSKCFKPTYGDVPLLQKPPRKAIRGDLYYNGELIDDGMAFLFPGPNSYTGEDTVEITCHGGILITRTVLEAVLSCGARMAQAGEFTRRAFVNGKLSLTEAESIGDLLEATNYGQIKLSNRTSRSHLAKALQEIHDELVLIMSSLYANIDYPEEDLEDFTDEEMDQRLSTLIEQITRLLSTYKTGRSICSGIPTVICGKPNVGKSSLYNNLCHEDVAIVTDIAGTTRDVLERTISLGTVSLHLFDTAGLHETNDSIEQIGVQKSKDKMDEAELILALFDGSKPLEKEDFELIQKLKELQKTTICIVTKSDLGTICLSELKQHFEHLLSISNKSCHLEELTQLIESLFIDGSIVVGEDAILSSARQYASLNKVRDLVHSTKEALLNGVPADVASSDLELAIGELSELDGQSVSEEIVSSIFSHFCIGK